MKRELKKLWKCKEITVVPVIIGARIEEMVAGAGRSQGTRAATESMPLE